jgi:hypothetical protein
MFVFNLLAKLINYRSQRRADETQLRRELLAHRRRELLHQHIPDVLMARKTFGPRFDELQQMLVLHDPGNQGELAADSPYYPELARTLLYQLPANSSAAKVWEVLRQEVSLWFGLRAASEETLQGLATAIGEWQAE